MYQILKGLSTIHSQNMIHRDLKLLNILLTNNNQDVKIGDLGSCIKIEDLRNPYDNWTGTNSYFAPELILRCVVNWKALDMWAVGCMFKELLTLTNWMIHDDDFDIIQAIFAYLGTPSPTYCPHYLDAIEYREV